eukprot:3533102-Prymnesium_polylepis.1
MPAIRTSPGCLKRPRAVGAYGDMSPRRWEGGEEVLVEAAGGGSIAVSKSAPPLRISGFHPVKPPGP